MPRRGEKVDARLRAEFNRLFEIHYDRTRDFIVLHYAANAREGEPLWDHLRHMTLPDSLAHKIELYRESAIAPDYALGLFSSDSWLSVFEGQGIVPRAYSPPAERLPLPELPGRLNDTAERTTGKAPQQTPQQ